MFRNFMLKIIGFEIDDSVKTTTLFFYCLKKFVCLLHGIIKYKKISLMCENRTKIKHLKLLHIGKRINLAHDVYLDCLSKEGIKLGNNVSIGCFTRIECSGSISNLGKGFICGNNCGLGTNCFYGAAGGIEIGNDVIIGNYVSMHSENHNYKDLCVPIRLQGVNHKGIKIGNNCWIGAKVTILDGTEIGDGCVIAAGAVVTGKFPSNVVIGGIPAHIIKNRG